MRIKSESVRKWVFAYLALPNLIFMIGWLRWEISVPAIGFLMAAMICIWRGTRSRDVALGPLVQPADSVYISKRSVFVLVSVVVLWCIMAGQGGFVAQATDWNWRNATLRDLITHEWPVIYDDYNRALVFYLGHWLPAAVVAKMIMWSGVNLAGAWQVGNLVLLLWTATGVTLAAAQMLLIFKAETKCRKAGVLLLLIFFGGMDLFGAWVLNVKRLIAGDFELASWWLVDDWWAKPFNFTSNLTCLYWVFHQTVATWVAIFYIASGVCLSEFALIVALVLICAPLPGIGIAFMVFVLLLHQLLSRRMKLMRLVKGMISIPNVAGATAVVFVVSAYLSANDHAGSLTFVWEEMGVGFFVRRWTVFICCEIGLYFLITFKWFRGNPWWWAMLIWLCFCSTVRISHQPDFCMRAMMPAFVSLSIAVAVSLIYYRRFKDWRSIAVAICLIVGTYVSFRQALHFICRTVQVRADEREEDHIVTFDQDVVGNFGEERGKWIVAMCNVSNPHSRFFYRYLAKRRDEAGAKSSGGRKD